MLSPLDSWYHLTLDGETIVQELETLVLEVADRFNELVEEGILDLWHYRFGGSWLAFRARAMNGKEASLSHELKQLGELLCENSSDLRYSNESRKWYSNWDSVIEEHGTEDGWLLWMESLHYLGQATKSIMHADINYWKVIHQYFNMIGWQEMGQPYELKPRTPEEFKIALGSQGYNRLLDYASNLTQDPPSEFLENVPLFAAVLLPRFDIKRSAEYLHIILKRSDITCRVESREKSHGSI